MLTRLRRRAEALDEACLRAQGHPHDHDVQQELLSALEWDESLHPEQAPTAIGKLFRQVRSSSADLARRIRSGAGAPVVAEGIDALRRGLAAMRHILEARSGKSGAPGPIASGQPPSTE